MLTRHTLPPIASPSMLIFLFALLFSAQTGPDVEPCQRIDELRADLNGSRSAPDSDEQLQALIFRVQQERQNSDQAACAPYLLRIEALSLLFLGEYVQALAALDRLLAEYPDIDAELKGRLQTNRGYLFTRLGRTADASLAYAAAADLASQVEPSIGAVFLLEASTTYRLLRQPDVAEAYLRAAEILADSVGDPSLRARTFTDRALQEFDAMGHRPQLRDSLAQSGISNARRALALYDHSALTSHQTLRTRILLAQFYLELQQPDNATEALDGIDELRAQVERSFPLSGITLDLVSGQLALLHGDRLEADRLYQTALRKARQIGERTPEKDALVLLGDLAADADSERAARLYREATVSAELIREALGFQDWSASAFERYQKPYRRLAATLLRQGKTEEAFAQVDAIRARYLRDLRASAALRRTLGPEQEEALAALYDRLRLARSQLAVPEITPQDRARHEHAAGQVQAEIEALTGARPAAPRPLAIGALQAALGRRTQHLVTYFLEGDQAVAFVVRADTFAVRTLPGTPADIEAAAEALQVLWTASDGTRRAPPLDALHRLHALIFAPVADLLPEGDPVVVIPEGVLGGIPFGLLVQTPTGRFGYADAPFLLRRHPLSTELAASLIVESGAPRTSPQTERPFIAFGRSQFEGAPQSLRSGAMLGPLPFVPDELEQILDEMGGGEVFLDEAATEHALEEVMRAPRLLHLATHVLPDTELPLYSHAVLWDDPDNDDDGILHAYEIEDQLLDLDLVVLSGCETGRGRGRKGEGMRSLQYAFRAAGARSTVATLWQVDDRAMAFVMNRFYHHLGRGARKDVALQQAQLNYLDAHAGALASPTLWAAPVLYGEPEALEWTGDPGGALGWVLLGLGALALAAVPIAYRRRLRARFFARRSR